MSVLASDIKFKKSEFVTDTVSNGGRKGQVEVISGVRHSLFPRVSKAERIAGVTRYRKEFWCNENVDDDVAYNPLVFLEHPSNGGDRFAIGKGTDTDLQSAILASPLTHPTWLGVGSLNLALVGAETLVQLLMENTDFE
ncbi:unnamed protein product, partial [marine sediment metagenome]